MVCPECGEKLKTKKSFSVSLLDLFGVLVVGGFFIVILLAIAHAMGPWKTAFGIAIVILVGLLVYHGGAKELDRPMFQTGAFLPGVGIGGPLLLLAALVRFFLRYEIRSHSECSKCGYKSNETPRTE